MRDLSSRDGRGGFYQYAWNVSITVVDPGIPKSWCGRILGLGTVPSHIYPMFSSVIRE